MKNKATMLLLGIGIYYLLYRLYIKKSSAPVIPSSNVIPNIADTENHNVLTAKSPNPYLVDQINTAELVDTPSTYQTFYGSARLNGYSNKVPSTC